MMTATARPMTVLMTRAQESRRPESYGTPSRLKTTRRNYFFERLAYSATLIFWLSARRRGQMLAARAVKADGRYQQGGANAEREQARYIVRCSLPDRQDY